MTRVLVVTDPGIELAGHLGKVLHSLHAAGVHTTVFDHVIVDNAGTPANVQGGFLFYTDIGPIIRNSTIRNSAWDR